MNRRAALRLLGSVTLIGSAGCTGSENPSKETPEQQPSTDTPSESESLTGTNTQTEQLTSENQPTETEQQSAEEQERTEPMASVPDFSQWFGPEMAGELNRSIESDPDQERLRQIFHVDPGEIIQEFNSTEQVEWLTNDTLSIGASKYEIERENVDLYLKDMNYHFQLLFSTSPESIMVNQFRDQVEKKREEDGLPSYKGFDIGWISKPHPESPSIRVYDSFAVKPGIIIVVKNWFDEEESLARVKAVIDTFSGSAPRYVDESVPTKRLLTTLGDGFYHDIESFGNKWPIALRFKFDGDQIHRRYVSFQRDSDGAQEWAESIRNSVENMSYEAEEDNGLPRLANGLFQPYTSTEVMTEDRMVVFDGTLPKSKFHTVDLQKPY